MALSVKTIGTSFSRGGSVKLIPLTFGNSKRFIHKSAAISSTAGNILKPKECCDAVKGVTLPEFLWTDEHVNGPICVFKECGISGRKYTHGVLYKLSRNFGAALMKHGLRRRDVVGVLLPNVPEYPLVILGILEAGLIASTTNPNYTAWEVAKQMNDSKAKAIVTIPMLLLVVREAQKLCPTLKSIIVLGEASEGCHSLFEMMKTNSEGVKFLQGTDFDTTEEIAVLQYSSGTTGPPKGVMLTHSSVASNIFQFTRPGYVEAKFFNDLATQEHFLGILPFFHSFGFTVLMAASLYLGGFTRTLPKFEPPTFIQALREHKPTVLHLVPPLIAFLANSPNVTSAEFFSIKSIVGGAAPIGETLISRLLEKAGKFFYFQEGYGMTELSPMTHITPSSTNNTKIGSCGRALPGTECKIVDPETGAMLGPHQRGELCIRGPQKMKGYFNNEKATAETIDSEGWLHTGDIAVVDDDQCFYIVDRMKELIKVKGLQVAPSELEDILRALKEDIADVAVIGVPDERAGELPRAYVVKKRDTLTEKDVQDFISKKVSEHKKLKGGVEFVSAIPKAASGKILRRELKAAYLAKNSKN